MHCGEVVKAEKHINQDPMSGDVGPVARIIMADGSVWWVRVGYDGQPIIEKRGHLSRAALDAELTVFEQKAVNITMDEGAVMSARQEYCRVIAKAVDDTKQVTDEDGLAAMRAAIAVYLRLTR